MHNYWLTATRTRLIGQLDITLSVDWPVKTPTQTNNKIICVRKIPYSPKHSSTHACANSVDLDQTSFRGVYIVYHDTKAAVVSFKFRMNRELGISQAILTGENFRTLVFFIMAVLLLILILSSYLIYLSY